MATVLSVIQGFCQRLNIPAPSAIVGVEKPAQQQYLELLRKIGDNLRNRPINWPQLKRPHYFNTETDVSIYQLPGDFYRLLLSDQWDVTNQWPLVGPVSDFNMALRQFAVIGVQAQKAFRLVGPNGYLFSTSPYNQRSAGTFEINPAGANDTDQLFLGYMSANWVWPQDWVASTVYAAGSIRSGDGYVYITTAGGTSGSTRPNWSSGSDSDGSVTWTVYKEPYACSASNAALTDSDFILFDEDLVIDGLVWAYKQAKGQDFIDLKTDWELSIKAAAARFDAPSRVNLGDCLADVFNDGIPLIPPGSWSV